MATEGAVRGVILVGGPSTGTRFRPLSFSLPKPLFPLANHALLWHQVRALARVPQLTDVVLVGFYALHQFEEFAAQASAELGITVSYLEEPTHLGNGGALLHFAERLRPGADSLLVLNGDVLCSFPLAAMLAFHRQHGKEATILATRLGSGAAELSTLGVLVQDDTNHNVRHFVEKPETFLSDTASCGVYVFRPQVLDRLAAIEKQQLEYPQLGTATLSHRGFLLRSSNSDRPAIRIEQDLLVDLCRTADLFAYNLCPVSDWWLPIKIPSDALKGAQFLLRAAAASSSSGGGAEPVGSVLIHATASVHPSAKLGPNVTIGSGVVVEAGVRISNSIVLDRCKIDANACIKNSIVGWDSSIGAWARIDGTVAEPSILADDVKVFPEVMLYSCVVLPHKELKENATSMVLL